MKKSIKILLGLLMIFSLVGCKDSESEKPKEIEKQSQRFSRGKETLVDSKYSNLKSFIVDESQITDNALNTIKHYKFIYDYFDENEKIIEVEYEGIKIIELLDFLKIKNYKKMEVINNEGKSYIFEPDMIDNKSYIAVYENGKNIPYNNQIVLINGAEEFFVKNIISINFEY